MPGGRRSQRGARPFWGSDRECRFSDLSSLDSCSARRKVTDDERDREGPAIAKLMLSIDFLVLRSSSVRMPSYLSEARSS